MKLSPTEIQEMLAEVHKAHIANYESAIAANPALEQWLAKPEKPTMPNLSPYWSMRGVVTGSRRKWK